MRHTITRTILCLGLLLTGHFWVPRVFSQSSLQQAFPNLSFTNPVDLQNAGDGSDRLFVVEQRGLISVFANDPSTPSKSTFLDIAHRVNDVGFEEGLLGLVFHPDYETNGYFYVNYTACGPNRTVVSRFQVTANPDRADTASEMVLLEILDPYENHNGGQLAFGPDDGYLYIATGDGGDFGDPGCRAQDLTQLLGKILRIDVDNPARGCDYGIPADNPFAGNTEGYKEEIYAYGLRNPWRFSFDTPTGRLWCGDVGQDLWEEIDIIENGGNYGWAIMEANYCYDSPWACAPPCDATGLIAPIWEYSHSEGIAVTGGYVYRGAAVPELTGKYIYTDWLSGRIWSLEYDGVNPPVNTELFTAAVSSSAFGIDEANELYLCGLDGMIYTFAPSTDAICSDISLFQTKCSPGGTDTRVQFRIVLSNNTNWSGTSVQFTVDGNPVDLVIEDNGTHSRAQGEYLNLEPGKHVVALVDPVGCFEDQTIVCSSNPLSLNTDWDSFDRLWNETKSDETAVRTSLIGNSPNPFNPSTQITYQLGQSGNVVLTIHNLLGQEVRTLVDGYQTTGTHSAVWNGKTADGSSAASGLYFYRLATGGTAQTQKMLLTK